MHVLVTTDAVGGVWTYTRELVTGLASRGVQITLVSFGSIPAPAQTTWLEGLPGVDFRPTGFNLEWMQDAEDDIRTSTEFLQSVVEDVKPELLHLNQYCYGAVAAGLPRIVVAHSDVVSWWVAVHGSEPDDSAWMRWYRRVVSEGLSAASAVVAPSAAMLENVHRYFGTRNGQVIYNGRSAPLFDADADKEDVVLAVGRVWDEGKNVALLLEAQCAWPIWIAGQSDSPESGGSVELQSSTRVKFRGVLGDRELRQAYSRAAVYAATSQYEPFGLAPVEAALSRCAIVASDIPTFHELWGDDVVYFRRNDASSLRAALDILCSDADAREHYAERAYVRARERFSADSMVSEYIALYQQLTAAGERSDTAKLGRA